MPFDQNGTAQTFSRLLVDQIWRAMLTHGSRVRQNVYVARKDTHPHHQDDDLLAAKAMKRNFIPVTFSHRHRLMHGDVLWSQKFNATSQNCKTLVVPGAPSLNGELSVLGLLKENSRYCLHVFIPHRPLSHAR